MQWRQADRSQTMCRLGLEFRGRHLLKFGGQSPVLLKSNEEAIKGGDLHRHVVLFLIPEIKSL